MSVSPSAPAPEKTPASSSPPRDAEPVLDDEAFQRLLRQSTVTLLIALLVPIGLLGTMVEFMRRSAHWVDHTDQVIAETTHIEKLLITMQSGFRGYRLLNDDTIRATYTTGRDEIGPHFDTLENLVSDNPPQEALALQLRELSSQWIARVDSSLARITTGESMTLINADMLTARPVINQALGRAEAIIAEEQRLRVQRSAQLDRVIQVLIILIASAVLIGIPVGTSWVRQLLRRVSASHQASLAASDRANRAKDEFLATLSHELRTPLTPVLLTASTLGRDPALPPDIREQLRMVERNVTLEARLIDDLLDLTKISRGLLELRAETCDAHALIRLAVEIVQPDAQAKGLAIETQLHADPCGLAADPARFQQVIWNLLRNAVKFTPFGGRITLTTRTEPGPAGDLWLRVEVVDSGIGIEPGRLQNIFEPFDRGSLAGDHQFGGLGLGLAIVRAIVQLHGGHVLATSAGAGRGATFVVNFPGARPPPSPRDKAVPGEAKAVRPAQPLRLLLVEDDPATLQALGRLLRRDGHTVITATTVASALDAAQTTGFDFVVSDLGLPDGSGIDLMTQLRQRHGLRGIALSGYGMEDDIVHSREAGFVSHLIKPVQFVELQRALANVPSG